jgi:hypothetical protein
MFLFPYKSINHSKEDRNEVKFRWELQTFVWGWKCINLLIITHTWDTKSQNIQHGQFYLWDSYFKSQPAHVVLNIRYTIDWSSSTARDNIHVVYYIKKTICFIRTAYRVEMFMYTYFSLVYPNHCSFSFSSFFCLFIILLGDIFHNNLLFQIFIHS